MSLCKNSPGDQETDLRTEKQGDTNMKQNLPKHKNEHFF